jgi:REP element-mobilizing transposase RayT
VAQALACVSIKLKACTMSHKPPANADPDGFAPIDPWNSRYLNIRRRNLPHLNVPGATYFITFRCNRELSPAARDVVFGTILACHQKKLDLDAAVVMPDHVHLIFRLLEAHELSQVLHHIKGSSARQINLMLQRRGPVWSDESFDHIIRQTEELEEKLQYIRQNPVKRGLVDHPDAYQWSFIKSIIG